uniref:Ig-like domain-containing protein n=1 Tax=Spermophilus dauricus TaxID=99837 RepID=A0A8C9PFA1_SPEDA
MESSGVLFSKLLTRGHYILKTVSLLTFWNPHPTAQLTIEPVPSDVAEGRDVLLLVHNESGNTVGYSWYRGQVTDRSRLIVSYSNITHSATQGEDTGFYTLRTLNNELRPELATGEIRVHVSLLTFWSPHPTAQLTIEPVPFDAAEGRDVLLLVHNVSRNTVGVSWYRGQITDRSRLIVSYSNITHSATQGPAFSGREIVYPNGSLLFVNLTKEDTGFYTLQTTADNFDTEAATGEIRQSGALMDLYEAPQEVSHEALGPGALSHCIPTVVSRNTVGYSWYRGQVTYRSRLIVSYSNITHSAAQGPAFSGREIVYPNGSLLFVNLTKEDTGFYTLQTTTAIFDTEAATGEIRVHGLVAQPSLRATNTEPHSVAMTCFSDDPGISITWILNSQTLQLTDRMQLSPDHRTLSIDPVRQEDAGEYQCEASNPASSTRSDRYRLAVICEWPPSHPVLPSHISLSRAIIWHQP